MVLAELVGSPAEDAALRTLASRVRGEVILPDSEAYDGARTVWNLVYDNRFPGVIVRAADAADVVRAVKFARANNYPIAVRSGGHGLGGHGTADGAVVIDLSMMNDVQVDTKREKAWVQTGARAGHVTATTFEKGYVIPTGDAATVGISGLTLGGGVGWLARKHGLSIDKLQSVELVTADGEFITASADENPDLFWAMRGGHGNFGVATRFEFQLTPIEPLVLAGALVLPATTDVIERALQLADEAPEDLTTISFLMHAPPAPFIPEEMVGQVVFILGLVWLGDIEEGMKVIQPFKDLGVLVDFAQPMPYPGIYALAEAGETPHRNATRQMFVEQFDRELIEESIKAMEASQTPISIISFRVLGGAVARVDRAATAYSHREKKYWYTIIDGWFDAADDAREFAWTDGLFDKLKDRSIGAYVNFLSDDSKERVADAYLADAYLKLAAVKAKYDPENVFSSNHNIKPKS